MDVLVDTGVLLRLIIPSDPGHFDARRAIKLLRRRGDRLITLTQNASEFWNVCTRPVTMRGGYGLSIEETARRLRLIERLIQVRPDSDEVFREWKRLVVAHSLRALRHMMLAWSPLRSSTESGNLSQGTPWTSSDIRKSLLSSLAM